MGITLTSNSRDPSGAFQNSLELPIPPILNYPTYLSGYYNLTGFSTENNLIGFSVNSVLYTGSNTALAEVWIGLSDDITFFMYSGSSDILQDPGDTSYKWDTCDIIATIFAASGETSRGTSDQEINLSFPGNPAYSANYLTNYQHYLAGRGDSVFSVYDLFAKFSGDLVSLDIRLSSETALQGLFLRVNEQQAYDDGLGYPWEYFYGWPRAIQDQTSGYHHWRTILPYANVLTNYRWPVCDLDSTTNLLGTTGHNRLGIMIKFSKLQDNDIWYHYYARANFNLPNILDGNLGDLYWGYDNDVLKFRTFPGTATTWSTFYSWIPTMEFSDFIDLTYDGVDYAIADKKSTYSVVQSDVDYSGYSWYWPGTDNLFLGGYVPVFTEQDELGLSGSSKTVFKDGVGNSYTGDNSSQIAREFSKVITYDSSLLTDNVISAVTLSGYVYNTVTTSDSGSCTANTYILHTKMFDGSFGLVDGSSLVNKKLVRSMVEDVELRFTTTKVNSDRPSPITTYINWGDGNSETITWNTGITSASTYSGSTHKYQSADMVYTVYASAVTLEQSAVTNPGYPADIFEGYCTVYTRPPMYVNEDGLCYWYRFDDDNWSADTMGNSNITTIVGGAMYNSLGLIGGCYSASSSGYLVLENPLYPFEFGTNHYTGETNQLLEADTRSDWTFCCWVRDRLLVGSRVLLRKYDDVSTTIVYTFGYTIDVTGLYFTFPGGQSSYVPNIIANDTWNHLCYTKNGSTLTVYGNGSKLYETESLSGWAHNFSGNSNRVLGLNSNILMDDLRIYNRALSEREIWDINKLKIFETKFDTAVLDNGNVLIDPSGNYDSNSQFMRNVSDFKFTPWVDDALLPAADTQTLYWYSAQTNVALSGMDYGYVFLEDGYVNTLSYSDDYLSFNSSGKSELTIQFYAKFPAAQVVAGTKRYVASIMKNGDTESDQIFGVSVWPNAVNGDGRLLFSVKTMDGFTILSSSTNFFVSDVWHLYTIQFASTFGTYAYRLYRDGDLIKQELNAGLVGTNYTLDTNNPSYDIRVLPIFNSGEYFASNKEVYISNIKIWKRALPINDIVKEYRNILSVDKFGSVYGTEYYEDLTISSAISFNIFDKEIRCHEIDEIGPIDGLIGLFRFDGNKADSGFSGCSMTDDFDGLHRLYAYGGVSRNHASGLYVYGDKYQIGLSTYSLNQVHEISLPVDIQLSGTLVMTVRDLDMEIVTNVPGESTYDFKLMGIGDWLLYFNFSFAFDNDTGDEWLSSEIEGSETNPTTFDYLGYTPYVGWHTYAISWDQDYAYLWIDGELEQTKVHSLSTPITTVKILNNDLAVGSSSFNFSCMIGELRIYDKRLDAVEMKILNEINRSQMSIRNDMTIFSSGRIKE